MLTTIQILLESPKMLFIQNPEKLSPLHRAASEGDAATIRRLVTKGANIESCVARTD